MKHELKVVVGLSCQLLAALSVQTAPAADLKDLVAFGLDADPDVFVPIEIKLAHGAM